MAADIIGLEFMDGSVWYCPRETLTSIPNSYLSARFHHDDDDDGNIIPPGAERTDDYGRSVYFIARDGQLFGKHILPYLATNDANLSSFAENVKLWRQLRNEATFYGLDALSHLLHVTNSFHPKENGDRGVLYWLGTDKGSAEYRNPYTRGAVHVTGWVDMTREEYQEIGEDYDDGEHSCKTLAALPRSRQALVQYRPRVKGVSAGTHMLHAKDTCFLLFCEHDEALNPVVIDLKSIQLQLTAYSLRWDVSCGMTDWNFEASNDGNEWQVLHAARDEHVLPPSSQEIEELTRETSFVDEDYAKEDIPRNEEIHEFLLSYVERKHRHFFEIEHKDEETEGDFYRYFRFTGVEESTSCLHGVGLELYGNVHEE
jgi:hypothetical protein